MFKAKTASMKQTMPAKRLSRFLLLFTVLLSAVTPAGTPRGGGVRAPSDADAGLSEHWPLWVKVKLCTELLDGPLLRPAHSR
jgi:hypothetical protein